MTRPQRWRLLDTGPARGSRNMALDEAMYLRALVGKTPPTVRFYAWSPPALSLGCFQAWDGEFDLARCRERGVELYRRVTGGRAVLHDDEVTYSVVAGEEAAGFAPGILPVYLRISEALAAGLTSLGLPVESARPAPRLPWGGAVAAARDPVCFAATNGYEITCRGHKIVGSALKRSEGAFLQHGSVLLSGHGESMRQLLGDRHRAAEAKGAAEAGLSDLLGRRAGYAEVAGALARGFARAWGVELVPGAPTAEELALAEELERDKYLTDAWNLSPQKKG